MTPPQLERALDDFNSNDLGAVLAAAGVTDIPRLKHARVKLWLKLVGDPARIQRALAGLTPGQRRALELLQGVGGEMRTQRFRSLLVRAGLVVPKEEPIYVYDRRPSSAVAEQVPSLPTFQQVLASLLQAGLIWTHSPYEGQPANAKIGFDGGRFVYIPDEVARHLPPPPIRENSLPHLTQIVEGSARTCQRDLYLLWSTAREAPLLLTNTGLLRVSDLKRVAGQLLVTETIVKGAKEDDYRRVLFLRQLATALEILRYNATANCLEAHPSPSFIALAPPERVRLSFQRWREGAWWNELWVTAKTTYVSSSETLLTPAAPQIASARQAVLSTLALLARHAEQKQNTPAPWVSVDDISDFLHDRHDEFLVDRSLAEQRGSYGYRHYSTSYYSPYEYNSLGWTWPAYRSDEEAGWKGVERVFIETVLSEGLHWLGLVDLGYAAPQTSEPEEAPAKVVAVRLTDMGRWLLLDGPSPQIPEESGRVVVQPNFRIFAFDPISDVVLARLDSFANRQNAERAIEYELTRETVYRAQLAGQTAGQIAAWLEEVTGAPLPQNVARSLAEWQTAFERITVRSHVGWVEAATPGLIDVLLREPRWSQAIVKRATPTGLIVRADHVDDLEQALLAAGELPARNSDPASARRASIRVDEDGHIAFFHAIPSLYVYGYLRPFCEQTESGWQITPRSVAQAAGAGLDAATILAHLETMAVGGVPPALLARIKAWSRHYGSARVQTLTLVQFRDQDALDELRSDPQLARLLKPFKPEARLGLAVVAPQDVAKVSALLAELGVDVRV